MSADVIQTLALAALIFVLGSALAEAGGRR